MNKLTDNSESRWWRAARKYVVDEVRRILLLEEEWNSDGKDENGKGDEDDKQKKKMKKQKFLIAAASATSMTALIVVLTYYGYVRRRNNNDNKMDHKNNNHTKITNDALSSFSVLSTLLTMFAYKKKNETSSVQRRRVRNRPEYLSAKEETPMSFLLYAAKKGLVQRAYIGSNRIYYQTRNATTSNDGMGIWKRSSLPPDSPSLISNILEELAKNGCSDVTAIPESLLSKLTTPILAALPFIYLAFVYRMLNNIHNADKNIPNKNKLASSSQHQQRTTFKDVAGLNHIVTEVSDIVSYLADPISYRGLGASPPRGLLLYGPPGSGKTLLARAIAGESNCDTFIACSGSDFVEMYVGRGAARVRTLFNKARSDALAQQRQKTGYNSLYQWLVTWIPGASTLLPINSFSKSNTVNQRPACAILFIDELDALAKKRSYDGSGNDEREQTLNQLLTEMDGFEHHQPDNDNDINSHNNNHGNRETRYEQNDNVTLIVIAASNRADILDPAILRRFDRQLLVPYPDEQGRKEILLVHARRIPLPGQQRQHQRNSNVGYNSTIVCNASSQQEEQEQTIDWDYLASKEMTEDFSGADLRNLVNEAALLAARENSQAVQQSHLNHAARRIKQMKASLRHTNSYSLYANARNR